MEKSHGPLPALLVVLTVVTGLVDAVSYFGLGHVFVANMTGNVVFLGFAIADSPDFSVSASLMALAAFLVGAFAGGAIGKRAGAHRARLLTLSTGLQVVLVGAAFLVALDGLDPDGGPARIALIALLSIAMGVQNATSRRLGVPDLTTTVLTLTLTGLAADSAAAGGNNAHYGRRLLATAAIFAGAAAGALVFFKAGVAVVLALALALLVFNVLAIGRYWSSPEAWTSGA